MITLRQLIRYSLIGLLSSLGPGAGAQTLGEALNATNLTWTTGGASPWTVDTNTAEDGFASLTSGNSILGQNNWVQTTVTGPTVVSFWWKLASTSCTLSFYIGSSVQTTLSGSADWQWRNFFVPPGEQTLLWYFTQNSSGIQFPNKAWLDMVALTNPISPLIVLQPTNQTISAGDPVGFTATVSGTEPISCQWQQNGANVYAATQSSYAISDGQVAQAGDYRLIVSNQAGGATSQVATLTVIPMAPVFTTQPVSRGAPPGAKVTFNSAAKGSEPLALQWYLNGAAIPYATFTTRSVTVNSNNYGNYWVVASNVVGSCTSAVATLDYSPVVDWSDYNSATDIPSGTTNIVAVAAGDAHAIALRADGTVVCWGSNTSGQTDIPPDATNIVCIAAGSTHSLAVRRDGVVKQWGQIIFTGISNAPPDATNIVSVAPGPGAQHALALRADGTVREWGHVLYASWVNPSATNDPPPDATNVVSLAAGAFHSLAVRGDGTLVAWGDNSGGQLNIPASASNVVAVSCGWYHSLALRADGRLVGWGGACGPGDCPRTVPTTATNIVSFACGGYSPDLAVRADGKLVQLIGLAPSWATNFAAVASGSSTAYGLVAAGPPKVTSPLANRSVVAGKTAYFYATAVGAWPLRYQWQLNGTNLPGATNVILAVTNALPAKAGVYSVLVSNAVGSASSQGATLTVLPTQAQIVATSITSSNGQFVLKATSPAGYVWMLQASVNLHNWSDVASATNASGAMTFTVAAADFDRCYFRLRLVQ